MSQRGEFKMDMPYSYELEQFITILCKWTIDYQPVPTDHWFFNYCVDFLGYTNCTINGTSPPVIEPVEIPRAVQDVLLSLYLLVMAISLIGNVVVLLVLGLKKRVRMLSAAYIISLSASGVIMAILAVPSDIMAIMTSYSSRDNIFSSHMSGDVLCKVVSFLKDFVQFANVFTAVGLSMERYLAVVHPLKARSYQPTFRTVTCIIVIWSVSSVLALPCAVLYQWTDVSPSLDPFNPVDSILFKKIVSSMTSEQSVPWYTCVIQDTVAFQAYHWVKFSLMLIVPTMAMSFAYISIGIKLWTRKRASSASENEAGDEIRSRTAKRVSAMMAITMLLFVLSWAPNIIYDLLLVVTTIQLTSLTLSLRYFCCWILLAHSAYNPLLHTFLHDNFRHSFADVLLCRKKRVSPKTDAVPSNANKGGTYDSSDPRQPSVSCSHQPTPQAVGESCKLPSSCAECSDNSLAPPSNKHLLAPSPVHTRSTKHVTSLFQATSD